MPSPERKRNETWSIIAIEQLRLACLRPTWACMLVNLTWKTCLNKLPRSIIDTSTFHKITQTSFNEQTHLKILKSFQLQSPRNRKIHIGLFHHHCLLSQGVFLQLLQLDGKVTALLTEELFQTLRILRQTLDFLTKPYETRCFRELFLLTLPRLLWNKPKWDKS